MIVMAPSEVLTTPTTVCDPTSADALAVAGELMEVLATTPYALAVAAPQIGSSLNMIAYRDPTDGPTVMSNLSIVERRGKQIGWESCLSFGDRQFWVERPRAVVAMGLDVVGDPMRVTGHDLMARMFCHEHDHLQGRLVDTIASRERKRR